VKFIRGVGRTIDWLGMRILLLLVLGLVGYAVLQPLIWSEVLNRKLPAVSPDLASLVGIVVTIMSLVLAVFGVVAYQLVERKLRDELRKQAERDAAELQDNLRMTAAIANAGIFINISYQAFLSYEDLWQKKHYKNTCLKDDPDVRVFLTSAIGNAEQAREQVLLIPPRLRARPAYKENIRICTGNLAYFLAVRASMDDKKKVLQMAAELDQPGIGTHLLDTVAWAYLRYSEPGQRLWNKGLAKLAQAMRASDEQPIDQDKQLRREKQLERYEGVFGQNPQILAAIKAALAGQESLSPAARQSPGT
jgi:hypothetical protein